MESKSKNNGRNHPRYQRQAFSSTMNKKSGVVSKSKPHKNKSKFKQNCKNGLSPYSPYATEIYRESQTESFYPLLQNILKTLISKIPAIANSNQTLPSQQKCILQQLLIRAEKEYKILQLPSSPKQINEMIAVLHKQQNEWMKQLKMCCDKARLSFARAKMEDMDMGDWKDEVCNLYGYVMFEDRKAVNKKKKAGQNLLKAIYSRFDQLNTVAHSLFKTLQNLYQQQHSSQKIFDISFKQLSSALALKKPPNSEPSTLQTIPQTSLLTKQNLEQQNFKLIQELQKIEQEFECIVEQKLYLQDKLRREQIRNQQSKRQIDNYKTTIKQMNILKQSIMSSKKEIPYRNYNEKRSSFRQKMRGMKEEIHSLKQEMAILRKQNLTEFPKVMQESLQSITDCVLHTSYQQSKQYQNTLSLLETKYLEQLGELQQRIESQEQLLQEKQLEINKYLKIIHKLKLEKSVNIAQEEQNYGSLKISSRGSLEIDKDLEADNTRMKKKNEQYEGYDGEYCYQYKSIDCKIFKDCRQFPETTSTGIETQTQTFEQTGTQTYKNIQNDTGVGNSYPMMIQTGVGMQIVPFFDGQSQTAQFEVKIDDQNIQTMLSLLQTVNQSSQTNQVIFQQSEFQTESLFHKQVISEAQQTQQQLQQQHIQQSQLDTLQQKIAQLQNQLHTKQQQYKTDHEQIIQESVMVLERKAREIENYKKILNQIKMVNEDLLGFCRKKQEQEKKDRNEREEFTDKKERKRKEKLKGIYKLVGEMDQENKVLREIIMKMKEQIVRDLKNTQQVIFERISEQGKLKKKNNSLQIVHETPNLCLFTEKQICQIGITVCLQQQEQPQSQPHSTQTDNLQTVQAHIQTSQELLSQNSTIIYTEKQQLSEQLESISPYELLNLSILDQNQFSRQIYILKNENKQLRKMNKILQKNIYQQLIQKGHLHTKKYENYIENLFLFVNFEGETYQPLNFEDESDNIQSGQIGMPSKKIEQNNCLSLTGDPKPKFRVSYPEMEQIEQNKENQGINDIQIDKIFDF